MQNAKPDEGVFYTLGKKLNSSPDYSRCVVARDCILKLRTNPKAVMGHVIQAFHFISLHFETSTIISPMQNRAYFMLYNVSILL